MSNLTFQQIGAIAEAIIGKCQTYEQVAFALNIPVHEVNEALMIYWGKLPFQGIKQGQQPIHH